MDLGQFFLQGMGMGMGVGSGRFEAMYKCHSVAFIHRPELEFGGKIILPPSALDMLTRLHIEYPMLFELSNRAVGRKMHCGVLEFVAEEGICYLPFWMMQNLLIEEGSIVQIKSTRLSLGSFVKFQPHTSNFLDISNPKAVLENTLRKFSALTKGDVIVINYNNRNYYMTVLETKPSDAISILETDISVDFAPPLDYKEPVRPEPSSTPAMNIPGSTQSQRGNPQEEEEDEDSSKPKFVAFAGSGARLDGKPSPSPSPSPSPYGSYIKPGSLPSGSLPKSGLPSPSSSPATKLTFGSSNPIDRKPAKEEEDEDEEDEDNSKKKFVAFAGKGYSLKS